MPFLQIKRNSKEFKEVRSIISDYADLATRKKWILLFALKPYLSLSHRVIINTRKKDAAILFDLAYDSLRDYFFNPSKKLFRDQKSGLYFFKNNTAAKWLEAPFELTGKLKKQVQPLSLVK